MCHHFWVFAFVVVFFGASSTSLKAQAATCKPAEYIAEFAASKQRYDDDLAAPEKCAALSAMIVALRATARSNLNCGYRSVSKYLEHMADAYGEAFSETCK